MCDCSQWVLLLVGGGGCAVVKSLLIVMDQQKASRPLEDLNIGRHSTEDKIVPWQQQLKRNKTGSR